MASGESVLVEEQFTNSKGLLLHLLDIGANHRFDVFADLLLLRSPIRSVPGWYGPARSGPGACFRRDLQTRHLDDTPILVVGLSFGCLRCLCIPKALLQDALSGVYVNIFCPFYYYCRVCQALQLPETFGQSPRLKAYGYTKQIILNQDHGFVRYRARTCEAVTQTC